MKAKLIDERSGHRTFVAIFDVGDEVITGITTLAREHRLRGSHLTAIGAFREVVLWYWDWEKKRYERIPIHEQVEVVSMIGNIALAADGSPQAHAHVVVGKRDGAAHGGHLIEAKVRPTLEVIIVEVPGHLQRRTDPATGLALIGV